MMGGDVTVTSELGKGSVFTARLPGNADIPTQAPAKRPSGHATDCILVIDDDATARELISDHLKAEGYSVVTASGGMEGLKRAKELRPTAITLDVMMPDLDGWSVLAALRRDPELADIPVIMVTIVDEHAPRHCARRGWLSHQADRPRTTAPADQPLSGAITAYSDSSGGGRSGSARTSRAWLEGPRMDRARGGKRTRGPESAARGQAGR